MKIAKLLSSPNVIGWQQWDELLIVETPSRILIIDATTRKVVVKIDRSQAKRIVHILSRFFEEK